MTSKRSLYFRPNRYALQRLLPLRQKALKLFFLGAEFTVRVPL